LIIFNSLSIKYEHYFSKFCQKNRRTKFGWGPPKIEKNHGFTIFLVDISKIKNFTKCW
jgi:hypothetical protein